MNSFINVLFTCYGHEGFELALITIPRVGEYVYIPENDKTQRFRGQFVVKEVIHHVKNKKNMLFSQKSVHYVEVVIARR